MIRFRSIFMPCIYFAFIVNVGWSNSILTDWNPIIINATIKDTPQPTIGTRTMAIVFTSAYDTWSAYSSVATGSVIGNTLDGMGGEPSEANINEAISHAIYAALMNVAPSNVEQFDSFMASKGYDRNDQTTPALLGKQVAALVVASRDHDGSNYENKYADTTGYQPKGPDDIEAWQPLSVPLNSENPTIQKALTPHWGKVKPFAIKYMHDYRLSPPRLLHTPEFDEQVNEIIEFSANLTDREKAIVEYWLPLRGTPPMLLAQHAEYVSNLKGFGLEQDVKIFFMIHNAMLDSSIACWDTKYFYNYCRPITAVRNLGDRPIHAWGGPGQGTVDMMAKDWVPYQPANAPTPPFPEYGSGHSTFSSSWAEVMRLFTGGDDFGFEVTINRLTIENVDLATPIVLKWETFTEAAEEAGISRIYGGIHFMDGNLNAQAAGRRIGAAVFEKAQALFTGQTSNATAWEAYQ